MYLSFIMNYLEEEKFKPHKPYHQSNFQHLFEIVAAKRGLSKTIKAIQICQEFRSFQKTHLPKLSQLKPLHFQNGILTIGTDSPALAQQLTQKRHQLQEHLNSKFGANTVTKIQTRLT